MSFANNGLEFMLSSMWDPMHPVLSLERGYRLSTPSANTQNVSSTITASKEE
jgi:hypothetical protein